MNDTDARSRRSPHVTAPDMQNPSQLATSGNMRAERNCECGCDVSFIPRDERQRYLPGHRFKTYTMHRCPSCGVQHREGAKKL